MWGVGKEGEGLMFENTVSGPTTCSKRFPFKSINYMFKVTKSLQNDILFPKSITFCVFFLSSHSPVVFPSVPVLNFIPSV